jgi:hypothetical protein
LLAVRQCPARDHPITASLETALSSRKQPRPRSVSADVVDETTRLEPGKPVKEMHGPVRFGVGDRVVMNETAPNKEHKRKGLVNGAFGFITDLQGRDDGRRVMTMRLDRPKGQQERTFSFPVGPDREAGEMFDIGLGFAMTGYKPQAKTGGESESRSMSTG